MPGVASAAGVRGIPTDLALTMMRERPGGGPPSSAPGPLGLAAPAPVLDLSDDGDGGRGHGDHRERAGIHLPRFRPKFRDRHKKQWSFGARRLMGCGGGGGGEEGGRRGVCHAPYQDRDRIWGKRGTRVRHREHV